MPPDQPPQTKSIKLTDAEEKLVLRLRQLKFGMAILYFGDGEFKFVPLSKPEEMTVKPTI